MDPRGPTLAQMRLERVVALAVTFLPDRELEVLAWRVEMALNLVLQDPDWQKRGNPASRDALLDTLENFRR